jgi:hypothetical protein
MLRLTIVNRKKSAALSAKLMIWLVSNIFGGFPSDLGSSTRTKPITPHKKTRLRVTFGSIVLVIAQLGPELGGAWCMKGSPLANVHGKHQTPPKKKERLSNFSILEP